MPEQTDQTGVDATLPAGEVIAIVREWVELHGRHLPNFAGAYLWGGITALSADAPFHLYRDVDVMIVMTTGAPEDAQEILYRGLLLEVIFEDLAAHQDAEAVLANPSSGPNLATTQILADPTGALATLQRAVAAGYRRRRWVVARCDAEKAAAERALASMRAAATPAERMDAARALLAAFSGLLAVAQLARPTTRRTLALLRELLAGQGRADLHEAALTIMGSVSMRPADVRALLDQLMNDFDRAAQLNRTPIPYGFAIRPHLRPYYLDGTRELIVEGNHREALYWIACLDTVYFVLQHDAPAAERPAFAARLQALYAALGYTSATTWAARVTLAERLSPEIFQIADALAALNPE